jgi:hypothetical protein
LAPELVLQLPVLELVLQLLVLVLVAVDRWASPEGRCLRWGLLFPLLPVQPE